MVQLPIAAARAAGKEDDLGTLISAKETRLDAVVLDKQGHQVTDLDADDFEVYQDNRRQIVNSCRYIDQDRGRTIQMRISKNPRPGRVIAFLVDNSSMDSLQVHRCQLFLKQFVETVMRPEDAIAVIQTLQDDPKIQRFSSDKQYLHSAVGKLRWSIDLRTTNTSIRYSLVTSLEYGMKLLRDMPGRKHLIAISAGTISGFQGSFVISHRNIENRYNYFSDTAFRAAVVVHLLDISGLSLDPADGAFTAERGPGHISPAEQARMASKAVTGRNVQIHIPLAKRTGGLFIRNSNLLDAGIGPIDEVLRGYYMLTYTPSADTFTIPREINPNNLPYHKIKIQLKGRTNDVLTRDGFYGVSQLESPGAGN